MLLQTVILKASKAFGDEMQTGIEGEKQQDCSLLFLVFRIKHQPIQRGKKIERSLTYLQVDGKFNNMRIEKQKSQRFC